MISFHAIFQFMPALCFSDKRNLPVMLFGATGT
jgi:hypothetical protein